MSEPSITCPACGMTSHNPSDVTYGYCGHCHAFTGAHPDLLNQPLPFDEVKSGMYFDRQGHPISFARWVWLTEPEYGGTYRWLACEQLPDNIRVATIWLGISMSLEPVPMDAFETTIFLDGMPLYQANYSTEAEALATHATLVRSLELVGRSFLTELLAEAGG